MYRQLYQMGGPIEEATNFFVNQQGLSPDQANDIISQGLQAYNQQTEPQGMMQMSQGGRTGFYEGSSNRDTGYSAYSSPSSSTASNPSVYESRSNSSGGGSDDPKNDPYLSFVKASQPRGGLKGIKDFFTGKGYDYGYQPTFGKFLNSGLGSLALGLINPVLGLANVARTRGPGIYNYLKESDFGQGVNDFRDSSTLDEFFNKRKERNQTAINPNDFSDITNQMAKLNVFEQRAYDTLKFGKDNDLNTPEQNEQLEELEQKRNESFNNLNMNATQVVAQGGRIGYGIGDLVRSSGIAQPVSGGDTSGGGFGEMRLMGKLIQQNPEMFRPASNQQRLLNTSSLNRDFIDLNKNGIDDREEAAQGGRIGYETGGVTLPSQGSELSQMQGMDTQQALETIVQILIENGIPPEQAQQLALQIIQIFAQGGEPAVEEFANQLEQSEQGAQDNQEMQMMAGGGIAGLYPRQGYGFGSIGKAVSGAVKGVTNAVKSVVKSDIGKIALTAAAVYYGGGGNLFGLQRAGMTGFNLGNIPGYLKAKDFLLGTPMGDFDARSGGFLSKLNPFSKNFSPLQTASGVLNLGGGKTSDLLKFAGVGGLGALIGKGLGPKQEDESDEQYAQRLQNTGPYLEQYYKNLNPGATPEQVSKFVTLNTAEYGGLGQGNTFARGGRIGYQEAGMVDDSGIMQMASEPNPTAELNDLAIELFGKPLLQLTPSEKEQLQNYIQEKASTSRQQTLAAKGGSIVPPARQIEGGVIELDARKTGGYIPYGKKERVDDVPAILAKDEFVFTSRSVKAAGDGSARLGAARMYKLMKQLEAKGMKMEQKEARA
jgi:hypothetical protein